MFSVLYVFRKNKIIFPCLTAHAQVPVYFGAKKSGFLTCGSRDVKVYFRLFLFFHFLDSVLFCTQYQHIRKTSKKFIVQDVCAHFSFDSHL